MPFEINAVFEPASLLMHGPLVPGAWEHNGSMVRGSFLVDTGAGTIGICQSVATALQLTIASSGTTHGFSGVVESTLYKAILRLPAVDPDGRNVIFGMPLVVHAIPHLSDNHRRYGVEVIGVIGRPFLQFAQLDVNGLTGAMRLRIDDSIQFPKP
jgi:hypothetical protein